MPGPWAATPPSARANAPTWVTSGTAAETPEIFRKSRRETPELELADDGLDLSGLSLLRCFAGFSGRSSTGCLHAVTKGIAARAKLEIVTPRGGACLVRPIRAGSSELLFRHSVLGMLRRNEVIDTSRDRRSQANYTYRGSRKSMTPRYKLWTLVITIISFASALAQPGSPDVCPRDAKDFARVQQRAEARDPVPRQLWLPAMTWASMCSPMGKSPYVCSRKPRARVTLRRNMSWAESIFMAVAYRLITRRHCCGSGKRLSRAIHGPSGTLPSCTNVASAWTIASQVAE